MAGSNGQITSVNKSASTPPVYTATVSYPAIPASPGPPPVPAQEAHEDTYIIDAADAAILSPHVGGAAKVDSSGTNGGSISNYTVKK
jgi:hypothetical protein